MSEFVNETVPSLHALHKLILDGDLTDAARMCDKLAAQQAALIPKDWMEHLGFVLDAPADGVWLVIDDTGAQREANLTERVLWKELIAIREALTSKQAD